jgi:hypothetical protein
VTKFRVHDQFRVTSTQVNTVVIICRDVVGRGISKTYNFIGVEIMKPILTTLAALLLLGGAGTASAQSQVLYVTNGDADDIFAIQGGVLFDQNLDVGGSRRYRVAVRDTVWLGDMDTGENVELTLDLDPTGNTSPTGVNIQEGTDGATDGTYNYTVESFVGSGDVYRFNADWSGGEALFTVSGSDIVGITYDSDNGTLWISDQNNVYEYSMAGDLLGQFAHAGSRGSLAYEPSTDTLWHVSNGNVDLRQYSKAGELLDTLDPGLSANAWGAEFVSEPGFIPNVARFKVTKTFSDGSDDEVDVMLTCNTGLPLKQTFTIAGGDPDGVTFVVTDIPESGADCEVTESGTPDGYTAVLNGGAGCEWEDLQYGLRVCAITNEANPATYTVYKDWTVYREGGDVVIGEADVTIECDSAIVGGDEDDGTWTLSGTLSDGETLVATVDTTEGAATCSASEEVTQSGVESVSVGCDETSLAAGGSHTCTFTNTVFFEGIPTLSQYGLAILVLLTLGVGFIGFRRFA